MKKRIATLGFVIILTVASISSLFVKKYYQTIQLFNGQIGLYPGQMKGYSVSIPDNAKNIYLRGSVFVSGGAVNTITINLYDASQCPPPEGRIDLSSCTALLRNDYSAGEHLILRR